MYVIVYTDGMISHQDMIKECIAEKWFPVCVYKNKETEDQTVLFFTSEEVAYKFSKRNLPKTWNRACIKIQAKTFEWIKANHKIEILNWPKNIKDRQDIELSFTIVEFLEDIEWHLRTPNLVVMKK